MIKSFIYQGYRPPIYTKTVICFFIILVTASSKSTCGVLTDFHIKKNREKKIDKHKRCVKVKNNSSYNVLVPTKTEEELDRFLKQPPPNINISECCIPSCTGKTCGTDGCGGSCGTCAKDFNCVSSKCCHKDTGKILPAGVFYSCSNFAPNYCPAKKCSPTTTHCHTVVDDGLVWGDPAHCTELACKCVREFDLQMQCDGNYAVKLPKNPPSGYSCANGVSGSPTP